MRMFNYVVISVFLALIFEMAGLSVASSMLSWMGISLITGTAAFKASVFYVALIALLAAGGLSGIAVGFITKSPSENYVVLPFIIAQMVVFSSVMIGIVSLTEGMGDWVFYITLLLLSPLIVGFAWTLIESFRGRD